MITSGLWQGIKPTSNMSTNEFNVSFNKQPMTPQVASLENVISGVNKLLDTVTKVNKSGNEAAIKALGDCVNNLDQIRDPNNSVEIEEKPSCGM